jgi:hypothetical protein
MVAFGIEHFDAVQPVEIVVDANACRVTDHVIETVEFNGE